MQVITIASAIVADTNTDFEFPNAYGPHPEAFVQIEISGTYTIQILGKLHPDASYVELVAAVTANTIQPVAYMPFMRVTSSGGASTPVCSVYVMIGDSVRV
jgi:hypothetical protein